MLLSNEKLLKQWHDTLQNVVNAQDWRVVTDSLKGYMTPELKKKLDGIATGANNYVHPSSHPATMITQDATHRFVSDTEKNTWNAKASTAVVSTTANGFTAVVSTTANGLAPKRDGDANHFLAGDGTWKTVASATKATQDSRGQQIDTTYVKGVTGSNATLTVTKGNGTTSSVTVNNVSNATTATKIVQGNQYYLQSGNGDCDENTAISQNKVNVVLGSWYSTGFRDMCSSGTPIKVAINHRNGNIKTLGSVTASGGFKGTADKATQDSAGQNINTTYIKSVTGSNATLTVTKGNGSTNSVTVNNVANATNANIVTEKAITGSTLASALPVGMTWSKVYNNGFPCSYGNCISIRGQGAIQIVTEWSGGDATPANMYYRNARDSSIDKWSAWRTIAHTGSTVSVANKLGTATVGGTAKPIYLNGGTATAINATVGSASKPVFLNAGTITACSIDLSTLAPKASPALTGSPTAPTQGTSDNSTKIATTAFVRNLINQFKTDGTLGGIVGGSLTQNGWVKFSNGLILQWGSANGTDGSNPPWYNFPIAFSNICYQVVTNRKDNGWGAVDGNAAGACNWNAKQVQLYSNDGTVPVNYVAIGK